MGATWSDPEALLPWDQFGVASKMTANPLIVTRNGTYILPFWSQKASALDIGPICASVLVSLDAGSTWVPHSCLNIISFEGGLVYCCVIRV